nr:MAG TPA: hypothetical protein [Bacteriophage sp.]
MKLKGIIEIDEANYKRDLECAFSDYLEEEVRTPERFRECMIDRLADDFMGDIILDEETIAQAIKDTKRFIEEALKNI